MAYQTYFDLVESLIVSSFGGPQDAEQRDIRSAMQAGGHYVLGK